MVNDLLDQVINNYLNSDGVCVVVNSIVYQSDNTIIWIDKNNMLHFEFNEEERGFKDFNISKDEIEDVKFPYIAGIKVSKIILFNGDEILINNF